MTMVCDLKDSENGGSDAQIDDDIGKYCRYATHHAFMDAASLYCRGMTGKIIPEGSEFGGKFTNVPDGYGGEQIFYGMSSQNIRIRAPSKP
jgi:hypothetical protein